MNHLAWQKDPNSNYEQAYIYKVYQDLVTAKIHWDKNTNQAFWEIVIGKVQVSSGKAPTLRQAKDQAEDALWDFAEEQRQILSDNAAEEIIVDAKAMLTQASELRADNAAFSKTLSDGNS